MDEIKRYRFFFHYRKSTGGMTVHFRGKCYPCVDVVCTVNCRTKRNKTQPRLVLEGWCTNLEFENTTIIIIDENNT